MCDDIVRTLRMAHRTLIVVLCTGLLFLASPNPAVQPYQEALAEIQQLKALPAAHARYKDEFREMVDVVLQERVAELTAKLNQNGFSFRNEDNPPSQVLPIAFSKPPWDGSIADLFAWLTGPSHWQPTLCEPDDFDRLLDSLQSVRSDAEQWRLRTREAWDLPEKGPMTFGSWSAPDIAITFDMDPKVAAPSSDFAEAGAFSLGLATDTWITANGADTYTFTQWAAHHGLLDKIQLGTKWLPACRSLWPDLSNQILESAERRLREEIETRTLKFQLLGISVSSRVLGICLPIFSIAILTFMWIHLRMLQQQASISSIAWYGLYGDWLSRTMTILTVAVLPVSASTWAAAEYSGASFTTMVLTALVTLLSLRVAHDLVAFPACTSPTIASVKENDLSPKNV